MATIKFKTKAVREIFIDPDKTSDVFILQVPVLTRKHCNMDQFRHHPKYGGLANSDLFPNVLSRISRDTFQFGRIRTDEIPANVKVDMSGFLAIVTIEV